MLDNTLLKIIYKQVKLNVFRRKWQKMYPYTIPMNEFNISKVSVGNFTYGELKVISFNNNYKLEIGNYVSIAQNVTFLLDVEHNTSTISTYPFKAKVLCEGDEAKGKGDIIIDDDVWIGYGATILSGVHIGQGAVIAAGTLVTKDVEPYSIVGGVPAKMIKHRFSADVIDFMKTLDYSKLDKNIIKENKNLLYKDVSGLNVGNIEEEFKWFPKK